MCLNPLCSEGTKLFVTISEDIACDGISRKKHKMIDSCLAPIVRALEHYKVFMRSSCCGHGKYLGHIALQDGRVLVVLEGEAANTFLISGRLPENQ